MSFCFLPEKGSGIEANIDWKSPDLAGKGQMIKGTISEVISTLKEMFLR